MTRIGSDEARGAGRPTVAVVGGGVGGLLAAIGAADHGARVVLLEPHPLGGRARTDQRGGFTFNRGPRALYLGGPAESALDRLGVDLRRGSPPVTRRAGAIDGGTVHRFPDGGVALARTHLFRGRERLAAVRAMLPLLRDPGPIDPSLSLSAWLDDRRVSGAPRRLVEAMVRLATYVDAPDDLPAVVGLAGARSAATTGVRYLDGGFGRLVAELALLASERGVEVLATQATAVERAGGGWRVRAGEAEVAADAVVLAVGTPDAAAALLDAPPTSWARLGAPATAACLELGVRGVPARRFCLGIDQPTYLSVHSPPARLAPEGDAVVHVMRYRRPGDGLDRAQLRRQLDEVVRLAGIAADSIVEERFLPSMAVMGAVPTVGTGGLAGRPPVALDGHPGAFLAGDWVGPVGLLLDAVAASAEAAGQQAAAWRATMSAR
jgi:phytoene dehydrogenase-like protein